MLSDKNLVCCSYAAAACLVVRPQTPVRSCHNVLGCTSASKKQKARNGQRIKASHCQWIKVQRERKRMFRETYCSSTKSGEYIVKKPRVIGERCASKRCCKSKRFFSEDRQRIFCSFWKELDWGQRKVYVANLANISDVKRRKVEDSRVTTRVFHQILSSKGR